MKKLTTGAAVAATLASGTVLAAPANAAYLGTMSEYDFKGWCQFYYYLQGDLKVYAINPADPHSFRCKWTPPGAFAGGPIEKGINYNAVCQRKYGDSKAWGKPLIPDNAFTWRCYN
jgi:hypothetical protein